MIRIRISGKNAAGSGSALNPKHFLKLKGSYFSKLRTIGTVPFGSILFTSYITPERYGTVLCTDLFIRRCVGR